MFYTSTGDFTGLSFPVLSSVQIVITRSVHDLYMHTFRTKNHISLDNFVINALLSSHNFNAIAMHYFQFGSLDYRFWQGCHFGNSVIHVNIAA